MNKIRDRAPGILLFLLFIVLALSSSALAANFNQTDVALAEKSAKALAITQKGFPAIATVIIVFYIFQSFLFRLLSDLAVHKWLVSVVLNCMLFSVFFGGSIGNAIGNYRPHKNGSQITRVVTDTFPGDGAIASTSPTSSATNFEVLARVFDDSDESLGEAVGENTAMVQTITPEYHTQWALDVSSATTTASNSSGVFGWISDKFAATGFGLGSGSTTTSGPEAPQQELYNSIASINEDEKTTGLLGGALLYLNNAVATVAGDIGAYYDSRQIEEANKGEEGTPDNSTLAMGSDDIFAASNITAATSLSTPVTAVTMATYPGGVMEYGRHALDAIAKPDKNFFTGTVSAAKITSALSASGQQSGKLDPNKVTGLPSPTDTSTGSVFDYAKQNGFDGDTEGVHPQYFLRAHSKLQSSECGNDAQSSGIRPGGSSSAGANIFNPLSNIPSLPIAANTQQLQGLTQYFNSLNSFVTGGSGNLVTALNDTIQMYSKLSNYKPTFTQQSLASTPAAIIAQYDKLIVESATNGMSHATGCLKNGKAMMGIATAVSKVSGINDSEYHKYLEAPLSTALFAEATSTLAWSTPKADSQISADALAARNENMASVSDVVNHIVGYVSAIGVGGRSASGNTKLPMNQETSWKRPDRKLEELAKQGQAKAAGANDSDKSWYQKAADKVVGTIQEILAKYYQFLLRLAVVLLAGMPFIALLTQVSIATTVAHISYSIGMGILPIWAVMNIGKLFSNASAGDESYNGVSFFPIVSIIATTACLGAEVAAATVCQGEVNYYLTNIVSLFCAQVESIGYALGVIFTSDGYGSSSFNFSQVLKPMMEATKPFGICAAATVAPMLIGRILMPGVIAPHGSASMVAGMASSAHEGGAAAVGGKLKQAAGAAIGAAVAGPAGAQAGASAAGGPTASGGASAYRPGQPPAKPPHC